MSSVTLQKWGGLASWMLAMAYAVPSVIYLVGDLRSALGPLTYDLADFLYGPVWAVSLISSFLALRARIGSGASGRMSLAWTAAWVAAAAMICVAFIRSANRHYHLMHPELHLESSETVLTVWATLVAGVIGVGFHFLGWSLLLLGSAGWSSRQLPGALAALYLTVGVAALFVYLQPELEGLAILLGVVASVWQGFVLWQSKPVHAPAPAPLTG